MPHLRTSSCLPALAAVAGMALFAGQAEQQAAPTGAVRGAITNSVTGAAVRNVSVTVQGVGEFTRAIKKRTTTDPQGAFVLEQMPFGSYLITANHELYSSVDSSARTFDLTSAEHSLAIELDPTAVLTGRVFDQDGEPARGQPVTLVQYVYRESGKTLQARRSAQTNDLGEFRLWGVPPGNYYLRIGNDNRLRLNHQYPDNSSPGGERVYPQLYYPGVIGVGEAQLFVVKPGEHRAGIDIHRQQTTAVSVRGRVIVPEGATWKRGSISFERTGPRNGTSSTSLNRPEFELTGVLPGEYVIEVQADALQGDTGFYGRSYVTVGDADLDGVTIELRPPVTVSGTLVVEGPPRSSDLSELMEVATGRRPPNQTAELRVQLRSEDGSYSGLSRGGGIVGPDGRFQLDGLAPNHYKLDVSGLQTVGYLKSAKAGGVDLLEEGLNLEKGGLDEPLEIVVGTDGGMVDVLLQVPVDELGTVWGVLVPKQRDRSDLYHRSGTRGAPAFQFAGVAPGEYTVFVFSGGDFWAVQSPEFLRRFGADGIPVKVEPKGIHSVESGVIDVEGAR